MQVSQPDLQFCCSQAAAAAASASSKVGMPPPPFAHEEAVDAQKMLNYEFMDRKKYT